MHPARCVRTEPQTVVPRFCNGQDHRQSASRVRGMTTLHVVALGSEGATGSSAATVGSASTTPEPGEATAGNRTVNVLPFPSWEATSMDPPAACTILCEIASPKPVPLLLVEKNGTNRLLSILGEMPCPVSLTEISTRLRSYHTTMSLLCALCVTVT